MSDSLWPQRLQHARPPCPSPTPGVYLNSCPLSWWCHPTISSSVVPFTSHLRSFPASHLNKKRSWSLFDGLLPVWSTTAFWILVKPLYLRSMLNKSMRCTENCKACSEHWSTERAQFFFTTIPDHTSHNYCFKVEWIGLQSFASPTTFTWSLTNILPFFKHLNNLLQGKYFNNKQDAENAFQEFAES